MDILLEILLTIFLIVFVIGFHELGHLVVGLVQGFRLELFVVGFFGMKREDDRVKAYFNTNMQYFGGVAATTPVEDSPDNVRKFANLILAGPLASILLAVILWALYYFTDTSLDKTFLIGSIMSVGIFFATTVPTKTGMFFTDRKRYQRLMSDGPERDAEIAMLSVLGTYAKDNNSYKNVDPTHIEMLSQDKDYAYFGLFSKLCQQKELDGAFDPETLEAYNKSMEKYPKSFVNALQKELDKV